MFDYSGYVQSRILPGLMDTRFEKPLGDLYAIGTVDRSSVSGTKIQKRVQTGYTSAARNITRTDVDPTTVGTPQYVEAWWTKIRQEHAIEISYIDIQDAENGGFAAVKNLLMKEIGDGIDALMTKIYDDCYAQMRLDLGDGTYSDAALNRSTYPKLATGYYDDTTATITVAYMRACQDAVKLNKTGCDPRAFNFSTGPTVYSAARKAIATLTGVHWNTENKDQGVNGGYGPILNFEGTPLSEVQGYTSGDVFYTRKTDLTFHEHASIDTTVLDKTSGRFSIKIIWRIGVNSYVINPNKNGLMINKG